MTEDMGKRPKPPKDDPVYPRPDPPPAKEEPPAHDPPPDDPLVSEQVTYLPGPEDGSETQFAGHHFYANLPLTIKAKKSFLDKLRGNGFFKVGEFNPDKDKVKLREENPKPKTSDQYKAYAVAWFKASTNLLDFDARWTAEENLRRDCGVGADDLDYLATLARPKRADLEKRLRP